MKHTEVSVMDEDYKVQWRMKRIMFMEESEEIVKLVRELIYIVILQDETEYKHIMMTSPRYSVLNSLL